MATPKRKTSHARTAQRKAQWLGELSSPQTTSCPQCGDVAVTYRACPSCGHYKGREVFSVGNESDMGAEAE